MRKVFGLVATAIAAMAASAHAQLAVIDSSNLAQTINTVRNTLQIIEKAEHQIQQAQQLFNSVNGVTDIAGVVRVLNNPQLRGALPAGMSTDLRNLGDLQASADQLFNASNFHSGVASLDQALEVLGRTASGNLAIAQNGLENAATRATGLGELTDRLGTATTAREVSEVGARASIEAAAAVNETNRLLATQMTQAADGQRRSIESRAAEIRSGDASLQEGKAAIDAAVARAMMSASSGGN